MNVQNTKTSYTPTEIMTVTAARALKNTDVCFVGIGAPSAACNLARLTHAPGITLIYESGTIDTKPDVLPLSIGDGELCDTAITTVSVPEMFRYWLQGGRISIGFLGAAQLDRFGNINTTVIGDYNHPKVRLPGAGGAPEIAGACQRVIVVVRHSHRTFVERVDFVTSVGFGSGPGTRQRLGLPGRGPVLVITDLGMLRPNPQSCELTLETVHPGVDVAHVAEATGWSLQIAEDLRTSPPPTTEELTVLRDLKERTRQASAREA